MALSTYAELQAAVARYLERADLASDIPDFITLAEVRMNRLLTLREVESDNLLIGTAGSRFIPLPAAYSEPKNLWQNWPWGREVLRFVPPELLTTYTASTYPRYWAVDGTNIAFERPLGDAYSFTLRMTGKVALSASQPTNAILANYPDAYLFGALCEAGPFLRDADLLNMFQGKFDTAMQEIQDQEHRSKAMATLSTEVAEVVTRRGGFNIFRGT